MTFYFYDLETTGFDPKTQRVCQFAGQRTDKDLNPIGEPHNFFIKVAKDVLPSVEAVLVTGITPQDANRDGLTEAEFLKIFNSEIATENTCMVGYNTIRFDNEFMRYMLYRSFYDPYEWEWRDGRSKWDILDMVRMTRALRPDNIKWPEANADGKINNRLSEIALANDLLHEKAHDALSDILATIAVTKLIKDKQPKLYDYLLGIKDKNSVRQLLNLDNPSLLVHTSNQISSDFFGTSIVAPICSPKKDLVYVYDLRFDPTPFLKMTPEEMSKRLFVPREDREKTPPLPVKGVHLNRAPALAPMGVLDAEAQKRIRLTVDEAAGNQKILKTQPDFADKLIRALELSGEEWENRDGSGVARIPSSDEKLYEGFFPDPDRLEAFKIPRLAKDQIEGFSFRFSDERLNELLPLYKARNFPSLMSGGDKEAWAKHCQNKLVFGNENSRIAQYFDEITEKLKTPDLDKNQRYLLEELKLWGEDIAHDLMEV